MKKPKKKHAGGRPKKTVKNCLPENWKEIILQLSSEGMSDVEIRAELCIAGGKFSHETWYALKERDAEFSETLNIGKVLCQAWWEKQSRTRLYHSKGSIFETGSWYANMKNRFGWRDKNDIDLGKDFNGAAASISALFRAEYDGEAARLAKGEDPALVLFGRTNGAARNGKNGKR